MKQSLLILLIAFTLVSCQNNDKLTQKVEQLSLRIDSLENVKGFKPGLGTLMNAIQIHHLKLWKSGNAENWELANFELHELEE